MSELFKSKSIFDRLPDIIEEALKRDIIAEYLIQKMW